MRLTLFFICFLKDCPAGESGFALVGWRSLFVWRNSFPDVLSCYNVTIVISLVLRWDDVAVRFSRFVCFLSNLESILISSPRWIVTVQFVTVLLSIWLSLANVMSVITNLVCCVTFRNWFLRSWGEETRWIWVHWGVRDVGIDFIYYFRIGVIGVVRLYVDGCKMTVVMGMSFFWWFCSSLLLLVSLLVCFCWLERRRVGIRL